MSNEKKKTGCFGYIGDEELDSHVGIIVNHYKDPYESIRVLMESKSCFFFFVAQMSFLLLLDNFYHENLRGLTSPNLGHKALIMPY